MADVWFFLPAITLIGGLFALAPLGGQVLVRGVVFIDLAVAQAAAAATLSLQMVGQTHDPWMLMMASVAGALACAFAVAGLCRKWPQQREALIGLLYVVGAMLGLLAAQFSAHGREDLEELLAADLLWSDGVDAASAVACGVVVLAIHIFRKNVFLKDAVFFSLFGVVASLMVQSLGVFLVFALLIAPAVLQRRFGPWRAGVIVATAIVLGLLASWWLDLPSGISVGLLVSLAGLSCVLNRHGRNASGQA